MSIFGEVWQVFTWRHARQPHVTVTVRNAFFAFGPGLEHVVEIKAVSRTDHAVRTTSAAIRVDGDDRVALDVRPHPVSGIPGVIAPYDSVTAYMLADGLRHVGIDLTRPISAGVQLSTGEMVWSNSRVLWRETAAEAA